MNEGLRRQAREQQRATADRRELEAALRTTLGELDHIRDAIRHGLLTGLTRQLLEEAEARARDLRAQLQAPARADVRPLQVLPRMIRDRVADLDRILAHDVTRARKALLDIVGEIVLRPTPAGLVTQLQGHIRGLLALGEQTPMWLTLVAGAGFEPATFGL